MQDGEKKKKKKKYPLKRTPVRQKRLGIKQGLLYTDTWNPCTFISLAFMADVVLRRWSRC